MPCALLVFFSASIGEQIKDLAVSISMRIGRVGCCACRKRGKPKAKKSNTNQLHVVLTGYECCGQTLSFACLALPCHVASKAKQYITKERNISKDCTLGCISVNNHQRPYAGTTRPLAESMGPFWLNAVIRHEGWHSHMQASSTLRRHPDPHAGPKHLRSHTANRHHTCWAQLHSR